MDIRQIESFQAVMTLGTTARAADVLGISQPAVSKAIAALERSIGFKLFTREKGRLVPTAEGQLYYKEVAVAFASLAKLRSAAARIRDFGSGELKIGSLSAFSTNIFPAAIQAFHQTHPDTQISLMTSSSSSLRDMVAGMQIDLAVTADEIDASGVEARPFCNIRAAIALPPGHALAHKTVITPQDLHDLPFVALSPEDTTRIEAESIFADHQVTPRTVVETAYSSTVCALVLSGVGCGIIDPLTATGYVERGLILRRFEPRIEFRTLLLLPPKKQSRLVETLIDHLDIAQHAQIATIGI